MSVTIVNPKVYKKWTDEGIKICIMCGQHNKAENRTCSYCCSSHIVPMEEAGCINSNSKVPEEKGFMILDNWAEATERIASYTAFVTNVVEELDEDSLNAVKQTDGNRSMLTWSSLEECQDNKWESRMLRRYLSEYERTGKSIEVELYDITTKERASFTVFRMNGENPMLVQTTDIKREVA